MKGHAQTFRLAVVTSLVLIFGLAWGSPVSPAPPSSKPGGGPPGHAGGSTALASDTTAHDGNSVSGEAFGVSVNTSVSGLAGVTVPRTPDVILPADGGMVSKTAVAVTVTGTLESKTLTVITTGAIGESKASAQSSATVETVNVLNGLVTADVVVSMSSSSADGSTATSNAKGSTLLNLTVNRVPMGNVTPAANTEISIPGVGTVKLNEQISGGDGVHSTELTVNMIHVVLTGVVTGDIIVASAHSDVNFTPAPTSVTGFMTGGGRLGTGRNIATFGFNAGPRGGSLKGQVEYIDHAQSLHVHGTGITFYDSSPEGTTCRTFSGPARVNDADGSFTVNFACDNGKPGVGVDTFEISVTGPGFSYSSTGLEGAPFLTGGNLQLH